MSLLARQMVKEVGPEHLRYGESHGGENDPVAVGRKTPLGVVSPDLGETFELSRYRLINIQVHLRIVVPGDVDLEDGPVRGGRFWRLTPMVNWYSSDHLRMEFAYGIGQLDRFELYGATRFFQSRLQFQF